MNDMKARRLRDLPGLGVKSEAMLAQVGVLTVDDLMQRDAYEIYVALKKHVPGTGINALYAILGAQEDRHWLEIARSRKMEILQRLDDMGLTP